MYKIWVDAGVLAGDLGPASRHDEVVRIWIYSLSAWSFGHGTLHICKMLIENGYLCSGYRDIILYLSRSALSSRHTIATLIVVPKEVLLFVPILDHRGLCTVNLLQM